MSVKLLEQLPLGYLWCRAFSHRWEEFVAVGMRKPVTGFRLSLRCDSCLTERHDSIDSLGRVGGRKYYYPDGYRLGYRVKKNEARLAYNKKRRMQGMQRRKVAV